MAASTLADVARNAGVSIATASRVLNGSARTPGPAISERVRSAAVSLGYVPNAQAQSLATSSSGLVGLIVHDISDPYFASLARGAEAAVRDLKKMLLLATTDGSPAEERAAVAAFASRRADAIILAGSRTTRSQDIEENLRLVADLQLYCSNGGRVGVVGRSGTGSSVENSYSLEVPNEELAKELADHLSAVPRCRFVVIAGPAGVVTSEDRVRGFQRGLAAAGLAPAEVLRTAFSREGGYDAGRWLAARIVEGPPQPNGREEPICVFAVNDVMAIGAVAALRAQGLQVPKDVLIAGFDDIETLRDYHPALTTVRIPLEDIGRLVAVGALNGLPHATGFTVAGHVLLRHSTDFRSGEQAEVRSAGR